MASATLIDRSFLSFEEWQSVKREVESKEAGSKPSAGQPVLYSKRFFFLCVLSNVF